MFHLITFISIFYIIFFLQKIEFYFYIDDPSIICDIPELFLDWLNIHSYPNCLQSSQNSMRPYFLIQQIFSWQFPLKGELKGNHLRISLMSEEHLVKFCEISRQEPSPTSTSFTKECLCLTTFFSFI